MVKGEKGKMKSIKFKIIAIIVGIIIIATISVFVIKNNKPKQVSLPQNINDQLIVESNANNENNINSNNTTDNNVEKEYLEDCEIAGNIEIPKTSLNAPVLSEASVKALNLSVAIVHGVGLNNVGNTVIMGNTYSEDNPRYELSFSNNYKLSVGDIIYIADQTNQKVTYEIYDIKELKATDSSYYDRDTQGKREITLVTENNDYQYNRLVIFAREK